MELKDFKYKGEETFYIGRNGMGRFWVNSN